MLEQDDHDLGRRASMSIRTFSKFSFSVELRCAMPLSVLMTSLRLLALAHCTCFENSQSRPDAFQSILAGRDLFSM